MKNPKKVFNVGDKVKVMIKSINDKKISLTAKFPEDNPWIIASVNFAKGKVIKGKVERITEYGAFVSLSENIDGLLHISELSYDKVKKVEDVLKVGQEIEVKVLTIDPENKKISLSLKALQEPPVKEENKENSDIVDVNIEEYGKKLEEEANRQNQNETN
jgi:small subunit ribosomal protein S1